MSAITATTIMSNAIKVGTAVQLAETGRSMNSGASGRRAAGDRPARPTRPNQWAHSAVDLNTGRVITTALGGPPTAEARAEALSRLGPPIGIFPYDPPFCRLSPRVPYQASPGAFLSGVGIDWFSPESDYTAPDGHKYGTITFLPPRGWVPGLVDLRALYFYFSQLNAGTALDPPPVLLTIPLYGASYPGAQGHVSVGYVELGNEQGPISGQVRVGFPDLGGMLWLDVLYAPLSEIQPEFVLNIEAGLAQVRFTSATIALPPPVFDPGSA